MNNTLKTGALLGLLTGLLVLIGGYFGGSQGMSMAFVMAFLMNFGAYWFSDRIVLAMYRAQPVSAADAPELHRIVQGLTLRAQMPMPRLYILPTDSLNAFATGRDPEHAAVAATQGILRVLNEEELEGVLAHELAHVRNRDTLISTIAATLAGVIMMLARMAMWMPYFGGGGRDNEDRGGGGGTFGFLFLAILAPIAAMLIQLAISRSREFHADESAARLTHKPYALASALQKLEVGANRLPLEANPATSHLFIVNPIRGNTLFKLFSTHPPIEERIARLQALTV
jgi:heat shock protein HtpX